MIPENIYFQALFSEWEMSEKTFFFFARKQIDKSFFFCLFFHILNSLAFTHSFACLTWILCYFISAHFCNEREKCDIHKLFFSGFSKFFQFKFKVERLRMCDGFSCLYQILSIILQKIQFKKLQNHSIEKEFEWKQPIFYTIF